MSEILQIPAVYIDDVVVDDDLTTTPRLTNRDPEDLEANVPIGTNIQLDIVDVGTAGIDLSATEVDVEGALAFDAGVFNSPYNGPGSSYSLLTSPGAGAPDGLRIVIDPTVDFISLQVVNIQVRTKVVAGAPVVFDYSFTAQDLTAPELESAIAINETKVRVKYNEPMRMMDDDDLKDALTPGNYVFTAIHDDVTPAVSVIAASVERIDDQTVDVTLDWEMTPTIEYSVLVENVVDLFDNVIGTPDNLELFNGFESSIPAERDFDLWRIGLAQINREEDGTHDLRRFIRCLQEPLNRLLVSIDKWVTNFDIDHSPEAFLDAILEDLGNPFAFDLTINQKRKLARILIEIYTLKGTEPGIVNVLRFFLGIESEILEYHDDEVWILGDDELGYSTYLGQDSRKSLYSFDVIVDRELTYDEKKQLRQIVDYMKPAHTHHINTVEP